ncbi:MAG: thermonuclease family protein [Erysipelotrichaceae bacterium]|nr:thermonuclease family protein [Erysipelotrichaceae bacterium]
MAKKKGFRITRRMKKRIGLAIGLLILAAVAYGIFHEPDYKIAPSPYSEKHEAVYQYIHDGDTAVFSLENGETVTCRFLAVDTPEIGEEGYEEAKRFTDNTLEKASRILIELDPNSERYDAYERLLAWVWVDGELMQEKIIENGLGKLAYIYHDYLYLDHLKEIEKKCDRTEIKTQ